ncbi:hypothetical protein OG397_12340 [Streptomyces sp. NBC_00728]
MPKERFISYARTNVATPDLYGWAGWDHREQAIALDTYIATHEGLTAEEVTSLPPGSKLATKARAVPDFQS